MPRSETDSITKEFAMEKAGELDDYKKIADTIEDIKFKHCGGIYAILGIFSEPKDGKKKSNAKKKCADDDEQLSEMS